jgi:hypothetical protein
MFYLSWGFKPLLKKSHQIFLFCGGAKTQVIQTLVTLVALKRLPLGDDSLSAFSVIIHSEFLLLTPDS